MSRFVVFDVETPNRASDSRACAEILLRYIQSGADISSYVKTYKLVP